MGFFSTLFGTSRFESRVVDDEYLGRISNDRHGCWNGAKNIAALGRALEVTFKTGAEPPSDADKQFFLEIEEHYLSLWATLRAKAFQDVETFEDGTTPQELFDSLETHHIAIYEPHTRPRRWEISATTPMMEGAIFRFQFAELNYQDFGMDD